MRILSMPGWEVSARAILPPRIQFWVKDIVKRRATPSVVVVVGPADFVLDRSGQITKLIDRRILQLAWVRICEAAESVAASHGQTQSNRSCLGRTNPIES